MPHHTSTTTDHNDLLETASHLSRLFSYIHYDSIEGTHPLPLSNVTITLQSHRLQHYSTVPSLPDPIANPTITDSSIKQTLLNCIDNSGAAIVECAKVLGMKRHARIGDRIVIVVQKQRSGTSSTDIDTAQKVKRGDIRHAVVVRTKKKYQRPDGSVMKFADNACVLISKAGEPIGTRLSGESFERGTSY